MTDPTMQLALRIGVTAVLGAGLIGAHAGLGRWRDRRRRGALGGLPLPELAAGEPTVLLFTGAFCSDCVRQKKILQDVGTRLRGWRMHEVHAAREQPLAARFGVQSVPATVILDQLGRPVSINYGLQPGDAMLRQLQAVVSA